MGINSTLQSLLTQSIYNFSPRGIDFAPADGTSVKDDAPIIVVQHGLSGGLDSINGKGNKLLTMPFLQAHMRHM